MLGNSRKNGGFVREPPAWRAGAGPIPLTCADLGTRERPSFGVVAGNTLAATIVHRST
jgi:hypothetical protein